MRSRKGRRRNRASGRARSRACHPRTHCGPHLLAASRTRARRPAKEARGAAWRRRRAKSFWRRAGCCGRRSRILAPTSVWRPSHCSTIPAPFSPDWCHAARRGQCDMRRRCYSHHSKRCSPPPQFAPRMQLAPYGCPSLPAPLSAARRCCRTFRFEAEFQFARPSPWCRNYHSTSTVRESQVSTTPPELEAHGAARAVARLLLLRELLHSASVGRSAGEAAGPASASGTALLELALAACCGALQSEEVSVRQAAVELLLLAHDCPGSAQRVESCIRLCSERAGVASHHLLGAHGDANTSHDSASHDDGVR